MKNTFEAVVSCRSGDRPVAIVAPICRSSGSSAVRTPSDVAYRVSPSAVHSKESHLAEWQPGPPLTMSRQFNRTGSTDHRRSEPSSKPADRRSVRPCSKSTSEVEESNCFNNNSDSALLRKRVPFRSSSSSSQSTKPLSRSRSTITGSPDALSRCNFYYANLTNGDAKSLLNRTATGTFLLRDSSDSRFRFSLSVKTSRGTTSIRISVTSSGLFQLDSDPHQKSRMPSFASILALVECYSVSAPGSRRDGKHRSHCVLLESSGRSDTPMILKKPLELSPAPLAHLCRRLVNNLVDREEELPELFNRVTDVNDRHKQDVLKYMSDYPFRV